MESGGKVSWREGVLSWVLEVKWEVGKSKKGDAGPCRGNVMSTENVWCIQGMESRLQHWAGRCQAGPMELEGYERESEVGRKVWGPI